VIRLKCDNCEGVLEVPDSAAGQKIKCPACGDVRAVPLGRPSGDDDRAVAAGLPPASGPEQRVLIVRQAMFRARPLLFLFLMALLLGGGAGAIYAGAVLKKQPLVWVSLAAIVLSLVGFALWKIRTLDMSLEITNKRTIERKGLLSRFTSEVRHQDIRNIQVTQSFFDRLMGVGRIGISSAAQDDVEIQADDIPGPDRIRRVIDLYRTL
jgi:membrane protein YdbS with pleckstrin-like domain